MKKVFGIIFIIIGAIGSIGMFASKAGSISMDHGFANFLGRLSPIFFLIIGILMVKKKKEN